MIERSLVTAILIFAAAPAPRAAAQGDNPYDGDQAAIRAGRAIFANRCADCHGPDARGRQGPDLTALWASTIRDERVFRTIRDGVPGSVMPATAVADQQIWAVVAYLKSISTVEAVASAAGDATRGRERFEAGCNRCHRAAGRGGTLGPDLSRIGRVRTRDQLASAIRDPSASVGTGYRAVSLTTRDGVTVRGAAKGEDAFSVQVVDTRGRLQGYLKSDLRELTREERSLMPAFGSDRLDDAALDDLLAYLGSLR